MTIAILLKIIGLTLFVLSALGVGGRINLTAAGLACWLGSTLV
jgi:hypothetical protein